MATTAERIATPVPDKMKHLPKDKRGYPIPVTFLMDGDVPHFAINDEFQRQKVIQEDRCALCGKDLYRAKYFVGGPLSALHQDGRYIDPPMHRECATYALKVCPYLAAPSYSGLEDEAKIPKDPKGRLFIDPTMIKERPALFVMIAVPKFRAITGPLATGVMGVRYLEPVMPLMSIEYWLHGEQVPEKQALEMMEPAFATRPGKRRSHKPKSRVR